MAKPNLDRLSSTSAGFGLTETLISLTAGVVLISASALALNSTSSLIKTSTAKANLRQNSANGTRLLRAEVERSLNILIDSDSTPSGLEHTNLYSAEYESTLQKCDSIDKSGQFKPLFGLKMADLSNPVIYGLNISPNGKTYQLERCGFPLMTDGRYTDNTTTISTVIGEIGVIPCSQEELKRDECDRKNYDLANILSSLDTRFKDDKTPIRNFLEPAIRIVTDENRKLIRLINPSSDESGGFSYLEKTQITGKPIRENLYFASYARADKRLKVDRQNDIVFNGAYFKNVSSKNISFLVDGSGSMSSCILWGSGYGSVRKFWNEETNSFYISVKNCSLTRMESLQHELIALLDALPDDTKITLQSFSSPNGTNHRAWGESKQGAVVLSEAGIRDSAIDFVNSLDDNQNPGKWGGTNPWEGLEFAFNLGDIDTLYFLSDGLPNYNHEGMSWSGSNEDDAVQYYVDMNSDRDAPLKVNTVSIDLQTNWMQSLSGGTDGSYLHVSNES